MKNFKPLYDKVLIKRIETDEKTKGGIIIPETAKEKPIEGEVISVGDGVFSSNGEFIKTTVKKGQKVLFGKWSGTEIKLDGDDYVVMKESDIIGVFE